MMIIIKPAGHCKGIVQMMIWDVLYQRMVSNVLSTCGNVQRNLMLLKLAFRGTAGWRWRTERSLHLVRSQTFLVVVEQIWKRFSNKRKGRWRKHWRLQSSSPNTWIITIVFAWRIPLRIFIASQATAGIAVVVLGLRPRTTRRPRCGRRPRFVVQRRCCWWWRMICWSRDEVVSWNLFEVNY